MGDLCTLPDSPHASSANVMGTDTCGSSLTRAIAQAVLLRRVREALDERIFRMARQNGNAPAPNELLGGREQLLFRKVEVSGKLADGVAVEIAGCEIVVRHSFYDGTR